MPYRDPDFVPSTTGQDEEEDDVFSTKDIFPPPSAPLATSPNNTPRRRFSQRIRRSSTASESPTSYTTFPEIEEYDPTYGLRPEGVPTHSGYEAFGRLWEKARQGEGKGLGALMSQPEEDEEDRGDVSDSEWDHEEVRSFDMVEMEESLQPLSRRPTSVNIPRSQSAMSALGVRSEVDEVEWETFPAVGGGSITRPRVYHSQSLIRAPSEAGTGAIPSPSGTATQGSVTARASSVGVSTLGVSHPAILCPCFRLHAEHAHEDWPAVTHDGYAARYRWSRSFFPSTTSDIPVRCLSLPPSFKKRYIQPQPTPPAVRSRIILCRQNLWFELGH